MHPTWPSGSRKPSPNRQRPRASPRNAAARNSPNGSRACTGTLSIRRRQPDPRPTYHGVVWEIFSVLLLIALGVGLLAPRLLRQRPTGDSLSGPLLVTGV